MLRMGKSVSMVTNYYPLKKKKKKTLAEEQTVAATDHPKHKHQSSTIWRSSWLRPMAPSLAPKQPFFTKQRLHVFRQCPPMRCPCCVMYCGPTAPDALLLCSKAPEPCGYRMWGGIRAFSVLFPDLVLTWSRGLGLFPTSLWLKWNPHNMICLQCLGHNVVRL